MLAEFILELAHFIGQIEKDEDMGIEFGGIIVIILTVSVGNHRGIGDDRHFFFPSIFMDTVHEGFPNFFLVVEIIDPTTKFFP